MGAKSNTFIKRQCYKRENVSPRLILLTLNFVFVKKAGCQFSFLKKAGRHQKGAGCCALQKTPRQNTDKRASHFIVPWEKPSSCRAGSRRYPERRCRPSSRRLDNPRRATARRRSPGSGSDRRSRRTCVESGSPPGGFESSPSFRSSAVDARTAHDQSPAMAQGLSKFITFLIRLER